MVLDPIPDLQKGLKDVLAKSSSKRVEIDGVVAKNVPWRPHVLERVPLRGWYIHLVRPTSDSWAERIERARRNASKNFKIGVAAAEELLSDERFLLTCHRIGVAILPFQKKSNSFWFGDLAPSVEDYICSARLKLSGAAASALLDRSLERALVEPDKNRKGVLLELVVAVLLSQVDGFEVAQIGIANRSQQMDVLIHNRNTGSALGLSPIVLAEAKNWRDPVDTTEYSAFMRKLQSRHGRARLGYLITTGRFTAGVLAERRRDSLDQTLIVLVNGKELPSIWRNPRSITERVERLTIDATVGV